MSYNQYGPEKYVKKRVSFLLKGLPSGTQQRIFQALDEMDLNVEYLAEKDIGYPSFKNDEFSEEYINLAEEEFASACTDLNLYLKGAGRPPFFHNPEDTCRSAKEFLELLKKRPYEELVAFFGASYDDYEPESWSLVAADSLSNEEKRNHMEQVILTNMCMVYDGDRILVEQKVTGRYTGIVFPGGHVEAGEPLAEAIIREVREETGLFIEKPRLCGIYNWLLDDGTRYMVFVYKTPHFSGTLKASEEGPVFWTTREEFLQMDLADGMREVLLLCDSEDLSENMPYKADGQWVDRLL